MNMPAQFWFTDNWTPNMFQAFMVHCWVHNQVPTARAARNWQRDHWNAKQAA